MGELADGSFSFWAFYKRRAARLLPALFVVLATAAVFASLVLYPTPLADFGKSLIATVLYFSNIFFSRTLDYFSSSADVSLLVHTWSLSVEEQYYLLLPLILFSVWRLSWPFRYALVTVLLIASLALVEASSRGSGWLTSDESFFLLPTRAFELLAGVLCALVRHGRQPASFLRSVWAAELWTGLGLLAICGYVFRYRNGASGLELAALVPVGGAALLLLCADRSKFVRALLTPKPLLWLGMLSYSIYLWHQPVLALAREYSAFPLGGVQVAACLVLTVFLAYFSWRFVEQPFRIHGRHQGSAVVAGLVVAAAILLAAGWVFFKKYSFAPAERLMLDTVEDRLEFNYGKGKLCSKVFTAHPCGGENATVAIWGDSYGMHIYQALEAALPGVSIAQMTKGGCAPLTDHALLADAGGGGASFARDCMAFHRAAFRWLLESTSVRYIFLATPWIHFSSREPGLLMDSHGQQSSDRTRLVADLLETVRQLRERGKQVILVGSTPSSGRDNGHCLKASVRSGAPLGICDFPRVDFDATPRHIAEHAKNVLGQALPVLDLTDLICDVAVCHASKSADLFIYGAGGHLSREGSADLGRLPQFRTALHRLGLDEVARASGPAP
ncbi:MAG: acyltransferase [Oxalobacteraceae bacterium]|nr:MAG: acyltransferase [Oxalobacteraceae bacterium]